MNNQDNETAVARTREEQKKAEEFNHRLLLIRRIVLLQLGLVAAATLFVIFADTADLGIFWFAFFGGVLGASLALLQKVTDKNTKLEAYLLSKSWTVTCSPFLYGGLMAAIVYFLMISGLISGDGGEGLFTSNLFPSFEGGAVGESTKQAAEEAVKQLGQTVEVNEGLKPESPKPDMLTMEHFRKFRPKTVQDGAKAIIWCFLGGYSESFVTGLLTSLEGHVPKEESE